MLGFTFVVIASFLWALDTLIRYPLLQTGVDPSRIVFTEHLFLVLFFVPFFFKQKKSFVHFKLSHLFSFFIIGVMGSAVATLAFTEAFRLINPSLVIILQKLQPFVAVFVGSMVLGEKPKKEFWPFMFLAIIGVFFVGLPELFTEIHGSFFSLDSISSVFKKESLIGIGLTLLAVVSWGSSTVFGKKLTKEGYSEITIMGGRFLGGFIFLTFYLWGNRLYHSFDLNLFIWGKIFLMVLISGFVGMYFYYKGLRMISARVCAIAELFFPLASVTLNWIILNKPLSPIQIVGAVLMITSATVLQWKNY